MEETKEHNHSGEQGWGGSCCLGLGGELIFQSRPEEGEEVSHVDG